MNPDDKKTDQLTLFDEFCLGPSHVSRILPDWDILSPFVFSKMREFPSDTPASQIVPNHSESVDRNTGERTIIEIRPAMLSGGKGKKTRFIFAGEREQLVATAIRALAVRGEAATGEMQDDPDERDRKAKGPRNWIAFTVRQLQAELSSTNHTFSHEEIMEALDILKSTEIEVIKQIEGEEPLRYSIRYFDKHLAQGDKRLIVLNELETIQIRTGKYRIIHYSRVMRLPDPVARWIYQFIHSAHRNVIKPSRVANKGELPPPFKIRHSELVKRGILAETKEVRRSIKRVERSLGALAMEGVLLVTDQTPQGYIAKPQKRATKGRAAVVDVEWSLYISERDAEQIIDAHTEAKPRQEMYRHLLPSQRIEAGAPVRVNIKNPHGAWKPGGPKKNQ